MFLFILVILIILSIILYYNNMTSRYVIHPHHAKIMIEHKIITTIIDVRTNMEYNEGHYPNSVHIPLQNISNKNPLVQHLIHKKISEYNQTQTHTDILIYCRTGNRAYYAHKMLTDIIKKSFRKENIQTIPNIYYINGSYQSIL